MIKDIIDTHFWHATNNELNTQEAHKDVVKASYPLYFHGTKLQMYKEDDTFSSEKKDILWKKGYNQAVEDFEKMYNDWFMEFAHLLQQFLGLKDCDDCVENLKDIK